MGHKDHYYVCPGCETKIRVRLPYSPDYVDCKTCEVMMEKSG